MCVRAQCANGTLVHTVISSLLFLFLPDPIPVRVCVSGSSSPVCSNHWQSIGPFHVAQTYPNIADATDPEDIGSIHSLWQSGETAFAASVNGGIWRASTFHTYNSYAGPHWEPVSDQAPCMSMTSVSVSSTDSNLVVAGCGYASNSANRGGEAKGVIISTDGGTTWSLSGQKRSSFCCIHFISLIFVFHNRIRVQRWKNNVESRLSLIDYFFDC